MSARLLDFEDFETLTTSILQDGKKVRFKAHGDSMHPFIQDGDVVEVRHVKSNKIKPGDIVLSRLPDGRLVVHRVIQKYFDSFLIQGDALPYPDGLIPLHNIFGLVDAIFRQGKSISFDSLYMKFLTRFWMSWFSCASSLP